MDATPEPALEVRGISKTYFLWATPASRLWVPLMHRAARWTRWWPRLSRWLGANATARLHRHDALTDISFTLQRGEALGIIGLNGSGKSTLLQIIAGVLPPTSGTVAVNGRVAALLELGSGFNPELTGRENVVVNGTILGLSAQQLRERMDDIIAFADIGAYIDEPVKTYSSGMGLRLAFAVQVHTDPDILIVDEALAVGDAAFQGKAMARIEEILARGTTLLFVGHDLNALRAFCQRGIMLERGRMAMQGAPEEVIEEYIFRVHASAMAASASRPTRTEHGFRSEDGAILDVRLRDGVRHLALAYDSLLEVEVDLFVQPEVPHAACVIDILDQRGVPLTGRRVRLPARSLAQPCLTVRIAFRAQLQKGVYRIRVRLVEVPGLYHVRVLGRFDSGTSFEMLDNSSELFSGLFPLPADIVVEPLPAGTAHDA
jgi:lipopolysaccharide transport system ATP-binding protein